jgi:hypothetical protein
MVSYSHARRETLSPTAPTIGRRSSDMSRKSLDCSAHSYISFSSLSTDSTSGGSPTRQGNWSSFRARAQEILAEDAGYFSDSSFRSFSGSFTTCVFGNNLFDPGNFPPTPPAERQHTSNFDSIPGDTLERLQSSGGLLINVSEKRSGEDGTCLLMEMFGLRSCEWDQVPSPLLNPQPRIGIIY